MEKMVESFEFCRNNCPGFPEEGFKNPIKTPVAKMLRKIFI
jgi:hypothetical protein